MPQPAFLRLAFAATISFSALARAAQADTLCEKLARLPLDNTKIVSSNVLAAGAFLPPGVRSGSSDAAVYKHLPAFCRLVLEATPSSDSQIGIEVWLPASGWNGKFRGEGNGGFAGSIGYGEMAASLALGYATAGTDTGHRGEATDAGWALGHPEKVVDFGYRAVHLMSQNARRVIEAYYGRPPEKSYFDSCSDGGREALIEAQRFPDDYDGILAGAPANYWTHLFAGFLGMQQAILRTQSTYIPLRKLSAINAAVLNACDALDRVRDGIITYQQQCHFDPSVLLCKAAETDSCLMSAQVQTLEMIYTGIKDSRGNLVFPPIEPGGETGEEGWKFWVTGNRYGSAEGLKFVVGFFQNMVYEDRSWDYKRANIDQALAAADNKLAKVLNATDPDLSAFQQRGGKLILYHGWLDAAIAAQNTIDYYQSVQQKMGEKAAENFVRLYMVPGMQHCAGGPGPFIFGQLGISWRRDEAHDIFTALEQWVENGQAPGAIIAAKQNDDHDPAKGIRMTRPLCPYPQVAVYTGSGNANEAASFSCKPTNFSR